MAVRRALVVVPGVAGVVGGDPVAKGIRRAFTRNATMVLVRAFSR